MSMSTAREVSGEEGKSNAGVEGSSGDPVLEFVVEREEVLVGVVSVDEGGGEAADGFVQVGGVEEEGAYSASNITAVQLFSLIIWWICVALAVRP
jgi:hypothetical protein